MDNALGEELETMLSHSFNEKTVNCEDACTIVVINLALYLLIGL